MATYQVKISEMVSASTLTGEELVEIVQGGINKKIAVGELFKPGAQGKSAYDVAREQGFSGNPYEWLVSLRGAQGVAGKAAYLSARDSGFIGSESEWIASLKGKDGLDGDDGAQGTPGVDGKDGVNGRDGIEGARGQDGAKGENGVDGKSAYEIAVAGGFIGTETAWLASLVGPRGAAGEDGAHGRDGVDGKEGAQGERGEAGQVGRDAYEVAADAGFIGTREAWLESLKVKGDKGDRGDKGDKGDKGDAGEDGRDGVDGAKGADGVNGTNGVDGEKGADGIDGKNGLDAYEVAVQEGFIGERADWLESLKVKGDQGERGEKGDKGDSDISLNIVTRNEASILASGSSYNEYILFTGEGENEYIFDPANGPFIVGKQYRGRNHAKGIQNTLRLIGSDFTLHFPVYMNSNTIDSTHAFVVTIISATEGVVDCPSSEVESVHTMLREADAEIYRQITQAYEYVRDTSDGLYAHVSHVQEALNQSINSQMNGVHAHIGGVSQGLTEQINGAYGGLNERVVVLENATGEGGGAGAGVAIKRYYGSYYEEPIVQVSLQDKLVTFFVEEIPSQKKYFGIDLNYTEPGEFNFVINGGAEGDSIDVIVQHYGSPPQVIWQPNHLFPRGSETQLTMIPRLMEVSRSSREFYDSYTDRVTDRFFGVYASGAWYLQMQNDYAPAGSSGGPGEGGGGDTTSGRPTMFTEIPQQLPFTVNVGTLQNKQGFWCQYILEQPSTLCIDTLLSGPQADTFLGLFNDSGAVIQTNDDHVDDGSDQRSMIWMSDPLAAGTYWIYLSSYPGDYYDDWTVTPGEGTTDEVTLRIGLTMDFDAPSTVFRDTFERGAEEPVGTSDSDVGGKWELVLGEGVVVESSLKMAPNAIESSMLAVNTPVFARAEQMWAKTTFMLYFSDTQEVSITMELGDDDKSATLNYWHNASTSVGYLVARVRTRMGSVSEFGISYGAESDTGPLARDRYHTMAIAMEEGSMRFYLNDQVMHEITDQSMPDTLRSGLLLTKFENEIGPVVDEVSVGTGHYAP